MLYKLNTPGNKVSYEYSIKISVKLLTISFEILVTKDKIV
jgi:hypothetical protein